MLFRCFPVIVIWFLFSFKSFAQKKVDRATEVWPQYYFNLSLSRKWIFTADYSHRYRDLFESKTQWIGRAGIGYNLTEKLAVSAGYAYSEYFSESGIRRENRPWQQIQLETSFKKLKINNRFRVEERFQEDRLSERFNYRFRFQLQVSYPLNGQDLIAYIADEPMINLGKEVTGNKFDQNRLQAGLQIKIRDNLFLTPAYMYTYQIQANKKDFRSLTIWRTGITYKR